ncbi:MAG: 1-deoxy-D-xylulose-5-phosphate synthase [Spirochaetes bacterium GWF1_51_8]|nr:MAG: 1-deoxy-D-xylulose-5-phosphate synthase [Spirochaetes bacterium GWF1_51_8]
MLDDIQSPQDLKKLNIDELKTLCGEIRGFLIETVKRTGGHLSPNLGVVELTVALHYVFDTPEDDIIWDVGHQCYVHKILTGRRARFDTLRSFGGLSGYPNPRESCYDPVHTGHSSTSLSIASGMARAKELKHDKSHTLAVIGDGSFTGGLVFEALNTISHQKLPVIAVLNDNGMTISESVGGITRYFNKLRTSEGYVRFKRKVEFGVAKMPGIGGAIQRFLYRTKEFIKNLFIPENLFRDMGMLYYGPFDGHNLKELIHVFTSIKHTVDRPVILHIKTQKGKGYEPSENDPSSFHGIAGVSINGDGSIPLEEHGKSYSAIFGEEMCALAEKDENIHAITAAMSTGTGLTEFAARFPGRLTDVGIAEQHAVDYAMGLSIKGLKPVVAIYSTFLQRAYDQLIHDIGIANSKVIFCIDRAGLVPGDGETHQGVFDISFIRSIPNFRLMLPATGEELRMMLRFAYENWDGPIALRYPRDSVNEIAGYKPEDHPLAWGESCRVREGKDALIVSTGTLLREAVKAAKHLEKENNISVEIVNLRFAKPINRNRIEEFSKGKRPVLIIEEGIKTGGVAEYLTCEISRLNPGKKVACVAVPDEFPPIGSREKLLLHYGLTYARIADKIRSLLSGKFAALGSGE